MRMKKKTEFVTNRQWDNCSARVMNKNIKLHGHSLSRTGIARRAYKHIVDIQSDRGGMIVTLGWRKSMKKEEENEEEEEKPTMAPLS